MEFFKHKQNCAHNKVSADKDISYCPDCGELIENQWYLVRCACCGVKEKAVIKNGEIVPADKFCHNCGTKSYTVERLSKINFIDINYAVLVKAIVSNQINGFTQIWEMRERKSYLKKLPYYK